MLAVGLGNGLQYALQQAFPAMLPPSIPSDFHSVIPSQINTLYLDSAGTTAASVDGLVGRANDWNTTGAINATQGTTGNKPTLRRVNNLTYLQFDGTTDYLSLSAVPFQMSDDHWVVVCAKPLSFAATNDFFTLRNSASANALICLRYDSDQKFKALWRDDAGSLLNVPSTLTYAINTAYVVSVRKVSNVKSLRVNGVSAAPTDSSAPGVSTLNTASIGASNSTTVTNFVNGTIYAVIYGKGTISDADLAAVERYAGSLGGLSL